MDVFYYVFSWGSPIGLSLAAFLSTSGAGILFWGISQLMKGQQQGEDEQA